MVGLRDYQQRTIDETLARLHERPCVVLPTGAGKTYTAAAIVRQLGVRTVWIAHRRELLGQAAGALAKLGLDVGMIMPGQTPAPAASVQVASIQTLRRRPLPRADLVVLDEAHHVRARTYEQVLKGYSCPVIGLTATAFRLDGKGLGDVFGSIVVGAYVDDLIAEGWLVEPVVYAPADPDLTGIKIRHGEYEQGAIAERMRKPQVIGDVVETWRRHSIRPDGALRRTIVFAVNVQHSEQIVAAFRDARVPAEHLDGKTPKRQRDAILHRLAVGYTAVVSQCEVLTEGWDLPALEIGVIARPTASLCLHLQVCGRVMRAAPEKAGCIAEGELVLTDIGLIPIERVPRHARVWDGVEWVSHDGPVFQGERDVIEYAGLRATADHEVFTAEGWKALGQCAVEQIPVAQTGSCGTPVRLGRDRLAGDDAAWCGQEAVRPRALRNLWARVRRFVLEHLAWPYRWLPALQPATSRATLASRPVGRGSAALHQPEGRELSGLWWPRNRVPVPVGDRRVHLDPGEPRGVSRAPTGPHRQRRALRARESALVDAAPEHGAHQGVEAFGSVPRVQDEVPSRAVRRLDAPEASRCDDVRADRRTLGTSLVQTKRRVWDLLNSGPRHRFTVSDVLVHNCIILDHAGNHLRHGPVTQRIDYTLDDEHQAGPDRKGEAPCKRCPECFLVVPAHARECSCGHEFRGKEVRTAPGELVPFDAARQARPRPTLDVQQAAWERIEQRRAALGFKRAWSVCQFERELGFRPLVHRGIVCDPASVGREVQRSIWEELEAHRQQRGYQPGWTGYRYKAIFGRWPPWRASA